MTGAGLVRPTLTYGAAQGLALLPAFLMVPLLTRVLPPSDYGLIAIFTLAVNLLNPLIGLSIGRVIVLWRFSASASELPLLVSASAAAVLFSGILFAILFLLLSLAVPDVQGLPMRWLVLAALSLIPQAMLSARLALWQAEGQPVRFGILQVAAAALNVGLSLVLVVHLGFGWEGRVLGHLAAISATGLIAFLSLRSSRMFVGPLDPSSSRRALRAMLPLLPYGAGVAILAVSDRLLVANWLDLRQLGIYAAAVQLALPVAIIGEVMNRAMSPWLLERQMAAGPGASGSTWPAAGGASGAIVLASAGLGAVLLIGGGWLLGPGFDGALEILPYLIAANGVGAVTTFLSTYLLAANRSGLLSWMMTVSLALLVLGCLAFLPDLDGERVAQAFLAVQLFLLCSTIMFIRLSRRGS